MSSIRELEQKIRNIRGEIAQNETLSPVLNGKHLLMHPAPHTYCGRAIDAIDTHIDRYMRLYHAIGELRAMCPDGYIPAHLEAQTVRLSNGTTISAMDFDPDLHKSAK